MSSKEPIGGRAGVRSQKADARAREAKDGWTAYQDAAAATEAKSARLRALRLEREAAAAKEPPAAKARTKRS